MANPVKASTNKSVKNTAGPVSGLVSGSIQYVKEAWAEAKRATWPSWSDVQKLTTAVFAGVIAVTLYIYVIDIFLASITQGLLGGSHK